MSGGLIDRSIRSFFTRNVKHAIKNIKPYPYYRSNTQNTLFASSSNAHTRSLLTNSSQHLNRNFSHTFEIRPFSTKLDLKSEINRNTPPSLQQCPVKDVIIYNRSAWARLDAAKHLKQAWPNVNIIEIGLIGQTKTRHSDKFIALSPKEIDDNSIIKNIIETSQKSASEIAFYFGWQPKAEDSVFVSEIASMGATPIAANPGALSKLAKKQEFKEICDNLGIQTSSWGRLKGKTVEEATQLLFDLTRTTTTYLKSDFGGGGRGTIGLSKKHTKEDIKNILRDMIVFSRDEIGNIYFEEGVVADKNQRLMQLEVEVLCDKHGNITVHPKSRFVAVNDKNQKFTEWGFSNAEDCNIDSKQLEILQGQAKKLAKNVGYDFKGTVEFLLKVNPDGSFESSALELNGRVQCEWQALGDLLQHGPHAVNTHALNVLTATGSVVPEETAYSEKVRAVCHDRIIVGNPGDTWEYPAEGHFDGVYYEPQEGVKVDFCKANISPHADYQMGNVIFNVTDAEVKSSGKSVMEIMSDKRLAFWSSVVYKGSDEATSCTYPAFMRKNAAILNSSEKFDLFETNALTLLSPSQELTDRAKLLRLSQSKRFKDFLNGEHKSPSIVEGNPKPTSTQIKTIQEELKRLEMLPKQKETLFSELTKQHKKLGVNALPDINRFFSNQATLIQKYGAMLGILDSRDFFQAGCGSVSFLYANIFKNAFNKLLPGGKDSPIFFVEGGGAQPAAAARHLIDPKIVQDMFTQNQFLQLDLARSQWGQGLTVKTEEQQAYLNKIYGHSQKGFNNFHAGNVESTTALEASIRENNIVIPNYVWDPTLGIEDFESWYDEKVKPYISICLQNGLKLEDIQFVFRIKNPGEKEEWSVGVLQQLSKVSEKKCYENGIKNAIMCIHNHNLTGGTSKVGADFIHANKQDGMPVYPVIDVAHQGNKTHNDILTISNAMAIEPSIRKSIQDYSSFVSKITPLTSEWDSRNISNNFTAPDSIKAGGTTASDIEDFLKNDLPIELIDLAYNLGAELTGLRGIVTPYSEANKQVGKAALLSSSFLQFVEEKFNIENTSLISAKHLDTFIQTGGTLDLPENVLNILYQWVSNPRAIMRSRDASSAVVKLVETSGYEPMQSSSLTPEQIKQELFQTYKDIQITEEDIYNFIQFGDTTAKKLIETKDIDISSLVLENPVAYVMGVNEGDILKYKSCQIEVKSVINSENGGKVILLDLDGEDLMIKFNPKNIVSSVEAPIILAESIEGGFGPNQAGELLEISKSVGESVEAGDTLFVIEALKQKSEVKATTSGKIIKVSDKLNGAPVKKGEWILTVK